MVTSSYCHHGTDRLTAVTTHRYTCTHHLFLLSLNVCDYKYCRASHHSSNSYSHFYNQTCNYTPLGFCEPWDLCVSTCQSVFHHVCRSLIVHRLLGATTKKKKKKEKRKEPSTSRLSASMAEHTSQVCVCPHLLMWEEEGKDNESRVAIATKRKVTPSPKCSWKKCAVGFGLRVSEHVGCCYNVTPEPWEDSPPPLPPLHNPPPSLPLPADRRTDCSCSASLSSVWRPPARRAWRFSSATWVIHSSLHRMKGKLPRILAWGGQTGNTVTLAPAGCASVHM